MKGAPSWNYQMLLLSPQHRDEQHANKNCKQLSAVEMGRTCMGD